MKPDVVPICSEHQVAKEWRPTTFAYSEESITVEVPDVPAWVCPADGEASFTPEIFDRLLTLVRGVLDAAKNVRAGWF
ncbi:MAG: YgiT-type zinc finger protein [Blastocatellia bacterium]